MLKWQEVRVYDPFAVKSNDAVNARILMEKQEVLCKVSAAIVGETLLVAFGLADDRDHRAQLNDALKAFGLDNPLWEGGDYISYRSYRVGGWEIEMGSFSLENSLTEEVKEAVKEMLAQM